VLRGGAEGYAFEEMEAFAVATFEPTGIRPPFSEDFCGNQPRVLPASWAGDARSRGKRYASV
jgi:hypothetical protein